ncbi:Sister chromatid cohesion protein [Dirofilaria immitis]
MNLPLLIAILMCKEDCKKSMPTGKDQDKRDNYKKPQNKGFSTASWEDRLTDNREEDDGDITDPELAAEKEYALKHGTEFNLNLIAGGNLAMAVGGNPGSKSTDNAKKDALISAKIKQAKADRKARGRGVSGSMCKKDKDISCGGFHTLMDMDVYYGLDDEYGTYMSDTEEPFDGHEDGYEGVARQDKKEKMDKSKATLINEDMNKMSLNDDNEREDDDRPGPSRSHHGASDDEKPKRLYRILKWLVREGIGWMRRVVVFLKEEGRLVSLFWVFGISELAAA